MRQVAIYKDGKYATSINKKGIVFDADTTSSALKMNEMEALIALDALRDKSRKATDGCSIVYVNKQQ
jgi:hypothetical protein